MQTMDDLFLHFLQDVYDAEKRAIRSMQKMARSIAEPALKDAILQHRDQSQTHVTRLERVFELVTGKRPRGKPCAAMEGLTEEVDEAIEEGEKGEVLDAALIACAQAIEHYEIARYGAMAAWARQLGKEEIADLLHQTLEEEKQTDQLLTQLAQGTPHEHPEPEPEPEPEPATSPRRRTKTQKEAPPPPEPTPTKKRPRKAK